MRICMQVYIKVTIKMCYVQEGSVCVFSNPCCLCCTNGPTRVSPANVQSCLEMRPPFGMMIIMDSVFSLKLSKSSLGSDKQAGLVGAGNAKYPQPPWSPFSSKNVTMLHVIYFQYSTCTHKDTQVTVAVISQSSVDLWYQPTKLPLSDFKVTHPLHT